MGKGIQSIRDKKKDQGGTEKIFAILGFRGSSMKKRLKDEPIPKLG
jgi:hypothetical protein